MIATTKEIYEFMNELAPFATAQSWDNSGVLVETEVEEVSKVLLALDISSAVVREAKSVGAQLILSHHPVIFSPLCSLYPGQPAYWLVKYGINALCAHTNLDLARGGVNDILAKRLCLRDIEPLEAPDKNLLSLGRVGNWEVPAETEIALRFIKENLGCNGIRYTEAGKKTIQRVAVCGGAGAELVTRARELGADALVTSDLKHNLMLDAQAMGIMLIDAGHYCTEQVILEPLAELLRERFPELTVVRAESERDPVQYL